MLVIDTNVLLYHLPLLEALWSASMLPPDWHCSVPFAVVQELDGLKGRGRQDGIGDAARDAIHLLHQHLTSFSDRIYVQRISEYVVLCEVSHA
jgi:hypothetical protein